MILMALSVNSMLPKGGFLINVDHAAFLVQRSTTGHRRRLRKVRVAVKAGA
ncbi:MAG: hypothetical protein J5I81_08405 [Nitrococcus mobilis]|nr:hypothetical protein [Nitrococcus mobilis]